MRRSKRNREIRKRRSRIRFSITKLITIRQALTLPDLFLPTFIIEEIVNNTYDAVKGAVPDHLRTRPTKQNNYDDGITLDAIKKKMVELNAYDHFKWVTLLTNRILNKRIEHYFQKSLRCCCCRN